MAIESHHIGMGDLKVVRQPEQLITLGLGSCIGLILYDNRAGLAGMSHIMLPRAPSNGKNPLEKPGKFAETAVPCLLKELLRMGAKKGNIRAKLAGGARMFNMKSSSNSSFLAVGEQNITATEKLLQTLAIPIESKDLGGSRGRSVKFSTETWMLEIKTLGQGLTEI